MLDDCCVGVALFDPGAVNAPTAALVGAPGGRERLDALCAGGAASGSEGVLADNDNAPAFVLGRGGARGILGPSSEPFALALLFSRVDTRSWRCRIRKAQPARPTA